MAMPDFEEYTYEKSHSSEKEALDKYRKARAKYPHGLVTLDAHECGHWTVDVYETEREKEALFRKKFAEYLASFWAHLKK